MTRKIVAGVETDRKRRSVRTVPSLPATRAKKDRISEAGFGFWVPIYVVPNRISLLRKLVPGFQLCKELYMQTLPAAY